MVSENSLSSLPEDLGNLWKLNTLMAIKNELTDLPDSIRVIFGFSFFDLIKIRVAVISSLFKLDKINSIQSLKLFGISVSFFGHLTPITNILANLEDLGVGSNRISEIDYLIGELPSLTKLNVSGNQVSPYSSGFGFNGLDIKVTRLSCISTESETC